MRWEKDIAGRRREKLCELPELKLALPDGILAHLQASKGWRDRLSCNSPASCALLRSRDGRTSLTATVEFHPALGSIHT